MTAVAFFVGAWLLLLAVCVAVWTAGCLVAEHVAGRRGRRGREGVL